MDVPDVEIQLIPEEKTTQKPGRSAPVLPWMRVPLTIHPGDGTLLEDVGGLDPRLATALQSSGVEVLFPVQSVVWEATAGGCSDAHDVCLAAPTGSGKTLAYSLPLLQSLSLRRHSRSLQALIVLPTRDLALQVLSVITPLCAALGIPYGAACGQAGLAVEAEALASGAAAVLVATPGRLIAHLEGTPGFSLENLRFLVVDEADRLLRQTYQNWLPRVLSALPQPSPSTTTTTIARRKVVKFIVSATLTKDPSKIDRLALCCPRYIAMAAEDDDHRYKLPPGLEELKTVVTAERKPFVLTALLTQLRPAPTIIFTSAVDTTRRLALMLRALRDVVGECVEYSAVVPPEQRRAALTSFRDRRASILVCSDAMTRGMDVEGVEVVINYDAPVYVKTYVHRVGRTARAGRSGKVVTLLRDEDVRHFKGMLRKADNTYVKDVRIEKEVMEVVKGPVEEALRVMAATLGDERIHGDAVVVNVDVDVGEKKTTKKKKKKKKRGGGDGDAAEPQKLKKRYLQNVPMLGAF